MSFLKEAKEISTNVQENLEHFFDLSSIGFEIVAHRTWVANCFFYQFEIQIRSRRLKTTFAFSETEFESYLKTSNREGVIEHFTSILSKDCEKYLLNANIPKKR
jgi:hypothetical protein